MAKQHGILKLSGTLDGLNFYTLNGQDVVRRAGGGFTGKAIRTKASMEQVRLNMSEFGHVSGVNKVLRHALRPLFGGYRDGTLAARLQTALSAVKNCDPEGTKGNRTVMAGLATAEGRKALRDFAFTPGFKGSAPRVSWSPTGEGTVEADADSRPASGATAKEMAVTRLHFNADMTRATLEAVAETRVAANAAAQLDLPAATSTEAGIVVTFVSVRTVQEVNAADYAVGAFGLWVAGIELFEAD